MIFRSLLDIERDEIVKTRGLIYQRIPERLKKAVYKSASMRSNILDKSSTFSRHIESISKVSHRIHIVKQVSSFSRSGLDSKGVTSSVFDGLDEPTNQADLRLRQYLRSVLPWPYSLSIITPHDSVKNPGGKSTVPNVQALADYALSCERNQNFVSALKWYPQLLDTDEPARTQQWMVKALVAARVSGKPIKRVADLMDSKRQSRSSSIQLSMVDWHWSHDRASEAEAAMDETIRLCRNDKEKAHVYLRLGYTLASLKLFRLAIEYLEDAEQIFKTGVGKAESLHIQGRVNCDMQHYDQAVPKLHQCIDIYQQLDLQQEHAQASHDLALAYLGTQQNAEAEVAARQSADIYFALGIQYKGACSLVRLSVACCNQSKYQEAVEVAQNSIDILRQYRPSEELAHAVYYLGVASARCQFYPQATPLLNEAVEYFYNTQQYSLLVNALIDTGLAYQAEGRYDDALASFHACCEINLSPSATAKGLLHIGNVLCDQNKYEEALHHYKKCLSLYEQEEYQDLAQVYARIGLAQEELGLFEEAVSSYKQSIQCSSQSNSSKGLPETKNNLGNALKHLERFDQAIAVYLECYETYRQEKRPLSQATVAYNLGSVFKKKQDFGSSVLYFEEAAQLYLRHGRNKESAFMERLAGECQKSLGNYREAAGCYTRCADIFRSFNMQDELTQIETILEELHKQI